ncbi:MAG: TPM domain-containing protein [Bacteroidia bacterium]
MSESANKLIDKAGQAAIVQAIQQAEKVSSGEIRVHLEDYSRGKALERAAYLFNKMGMRATIARNGVLLYVAVKDHVLAIYGDEGIDAAVGQNFWEAEIALMTEHFKRGDYAGGLVAAICQVGEKLVEHFPNQGDNDQNELSDEISFG